MKTNMGAKPLSKRHVERVWGRRDLAGDFAPPPELASVPIGEIWFEGARDAPLLVKYLFTSERLSIQVHPGDSDARARGYPRGKDEAWYVLRAEPGATIGIGLTSSLSQEELRASALDGSIERLLDWRPVSAGDAFYSPAGTIHAIGAGGTLIEIQQNVDLTYRLYDYGRPRELHLDQAIAVARPEPWQAPTKPRPAGSGRTILAEGGAFVLERWSGEAAEAEGGTLIIPLKTGGTIDGQALEAGTVWSVEREATLDGGFDLLAAYPGGSARA